MGELDLSYKMADSGRQIRENEDTMLAKKKEALRIQAERQTVNFLRHLLCEDIKLAKQTSMDIVFDEGEFNGNLTVYCKVFKNKELDIEIPIQVVSDMLTFPPQENITKLFPQPTKANTTVVSDKKDINSSLVAEQSLKNIEKEKEQFVKIAEQKVSELLTTMKYSGVKFYKESSILLNRNADKTYTGRIDVFAQLLDNYGEKKVKIPVIFKDSIVELPESMILEKEIATEDSSEEKDEIDIDKEIEEKIKKIDEEEKYKEDETLKALELGPQVATQDGKIEKKASDSQEPHLMEYAPIIHVHKSVLPDSLAIGDVINLDGMHYKIVEDDASKLSTVGTGSMWTLRMIETDEKVDYKVTNN